MSNNYYYIHNYIHTCTVGAFLRRLLLLLDPTKLPCVPTISDLYRNLNLSTGCSKIVIYGVSITERKIIKYIL